MTGSRKITLAIALVVFMAIFAVVPASATGEGSISIHKFYDSDADGEWDYGEPYLDGWLINVQSVNGPSQFCTKAVGDSTIVLPEGAVTLTEADPIQTNWRATTPKTITIPLLIGWIPTKFGNICLGGGNARTPGFWSNQNGYAKMYQMGMADTLQDLRDLNLWVRNADGNVIQFNPTTYAQFRTWLVNRNAIDMRYQLSAFLAAMTLNVNAGFVDEDAEIYVTGVGFVPVDNVLAAANNALAPDSGASRYQLTILKDALDKACNNQNYGVMDVADCPYTFAQACPA